MNLPIKYIIEILEIVRYIYKYNKSYKGVLHEKNCHFDSLSFYR